MKPIRLKMQCFGSFTDKCEIDFEKLSRSRIFLITGQTGSGKTTILDAMCCALYGAPTGENRQWESMRSALAEESSPTKVSFEFAIDDRRYKFRRTLAIRSRTRNGEKVRVAETESAAYELLCGEWSMIAKNAGEVKNMSQQLLGFTREQFVQITVLPQGEFKRLLLARSKEKSEILESLFLASRWKDFAARMNAKSRSLYGELCDLRTEYNTVIASTGCESSTELSDRETKCREQSKTIAEQNKKLLLEIAQEQKKLDEMRSLSDSFAQLDRWQKQYDDLEMQKKAFKELRAQTEKNERLTALLPYRDNASAAKNSYKDQCARTKTILQQLEAARLFFENAEKEYEKLPELKSQAEQMRLKTQELKRQLSDKRHLRDAEKQLSELGISFRMSEEKLVNQQSELIAAREKFRAGEKKWLAALEQMNQIPIIAERVNYLERAVWQLDELDRLKNRLALAQEKKRKCDEQARAAKLRHDALEKSIGEMQSSLMQNSAYALSLNLAQDKPCPVCGSLHHPKIAEKPQDSPSHEDFDAAGVALEQSRKLLSKTTDQQNEAASDLAAITELLNHQEQQCDEYDKTAEQYKTECVQLKAELERLRKLQDKKEETQQRKEKLADEIEKKQSELEQTRRYISELGGLISGKKGEIELVKSSMENPDEDEQALLCRIEELTRRADKADEKCGFLQKSYNEAGAALAQSEQQLSSSQNSEQEKKNNYEKAKEEFLFRLKAENIEPTADMFDGLPERDELGRQKQSVERFFRELHSARQRIEEYAALTDGKQRPDTESAHNELLELRETASQQQMTLGKLQSDLKNLERMHKKAVSLNSEIETKEKNYSTVSRLSMLLNGKNALNTPIHQFVLGIMLENIVQYANTYLYRFSRGKYSLARVNREGGHGYMGMELDVIDGYTGTSRDVKTLSGGEIFIASLSLAFGLSDAVQSFAGGIRVDSLFIDEGFGSLDSETLEAAMRALNDILKSDRMIGIISHVEQLRDSIAARIEVSRSENGSAQAHVIC